jgi:hypothetical protein
VFADRVARTTAGEVTDPPNAVADQHWPVVAPRPAYERPADAAQGMVKTGTKGPSDLSTIVDEPPREGHAGVAQGAAKAREDAALSLDIGHHRIEDLIAAPGTREAIGQAERILIECERITRDQAFAVLLRASRFLSRAGKFGRRACAIQQIRMARIRSRRRLSALGGKGKSTTALPRLRACNRPGCQCG